MSLKATVIIPTYGKRVEYIVDTVRSVQNQSLAGDDYEILVVDNSPRKDVKEIVDKLNSDSQRKARYTAESEPGLYKARHRGASEALGSILVYIDDDIIAPRGWLEALISPFQDARVACVGGKVLPKWEGALPDWKGHFDDNYHSLLDFGENTLELKWPQAAWGCNMAVRKDVLYQVKGFHPDGFGDGKMVWFRGDGECGMQQKIYQAGYRILYEPSAWLYHRIPATRLTEKYFYKRLFTQGIDDSFTQMRTLRETPYIKARWLYEAVFFYLISLKKYLISYKTKKYRVRVKADAFYWYGKAEHRRRVALNKKLREHVFKENFL